MNRTTARLAVTLAGAGALTGLAVGAAHADTPDATGSASDTTAATDATGTDGTEAGDQAGSTDGLAPNYVLQGAPAAPIGNPVSNVFDVTAPAYGVLGALG